MFLGFSVAAIPAAIYARGVKLCQQRLTVLWPLEDSSAATVLLLARWLCWFATWPARRLQYSSGILSPFMEHNCLQRGRHSAQGRLDNHRVVHVGGVAVPRAVSVKELHHLGESSCAIAVSRERLGSTERDAAGP